mmetsp:Transcript_125913/g.356090  ORF Transcript_125913/g.356090 Transcript_125913/m.356090 type:complete len:204 (-) Transcript_125913:18-629(-)
MEDELCLVLGLLDVGDSFVIEAIHPQYSDILKAVGDDIAFCFGQLQQAQSVEHAEKANETSSELFDCIGVCLRRLHESHDVAHRVVKGARHLLHQGTPLPVPAVTLRGAEDYEEGEGGGERREAPVAHLPHLHEPPQAPSVVVLHVLEERGQQRAGQRERECEGQDAALPGERTSAERPWGELHRGGPRRGDTSEVGAVVKPP